MVTKYRRMQMASNKDPFATALATVVIVVLLMVIFW